MKLLKFFLFGVYFGIVLIKAEVVSWFRIQEMFYFQSIHMYGIIGSAVVVGAVSVFLIRKFNLRATDGSEIKLEAKPFNKIGNLVGGIVFGLGWALVGACPGPLYALVGAGYWSILVALAGAFAGVVVYGYTKPYLPH